MADRAEILRARAEQCRQQAAKTAGPIDKQRLLRRSDEWLRLAQLRCSVQPKTLEPDEGATLRYPAVH